MQFRHEVEVHSVEATDEGRRQEDDIDDCEDFDDAVLLNINQTKEGILEVVETVKTETSVVKERVDILDDHRQTRIEFFRKEIAFKNIGYYTLFIHYVLTNDSYFFL